MSHHTGSHACTDPSRTIYILTYENNNWYEPLTGTEGVTLHDRRATFGALGVYLTRELAEWVGEAWLMQQLENRINGYDDPPDTEQEWEIARDEWDGGSRRENGRWSSGYYNDRSESVEVVVEERTMLSHVPGFEAEAEEDEENSDKEESEEEEEEEEKEEEKEKEDNEKKEKEDNEKKNNDTKKINEEKNGKGKEKHEDENEKKADDDKSQVDDNDDQGTESENIHTGSNTTEETGDRDPTHLTGKRKREAGDL